MTNEELAQGLFRQAQSRFKTMKEAFQSQDYPYAVRTAQECVELSLNALLVSAGIDPPKWHDVGTILMENASRFPSINKSAINEIAFISRSLRGEREKSMYGDEVLGLPPDRLYSRYDAETAQKWAEGGFFRVLPALYRLTSLSPSL
jgi:HEPN domain-containing protein